MSEPTLHERWIAAHKGEYLFSAGYVWFCEDYDCYCTQAMVMDYYRNLRIPNARVPVSAWEGTFFTEHADGADEELVAYRKQLKAEDPAREAAIQWQEGIDYET